MVVGVESCTKINTGFSVGRLVLSDCRSGKERGQPLNCRSRPRYFSGCKISRPRNEIYVGVKFSEQKFLNILHTILPLKCVHYCCKMWFIRRKRAYGISRYFCRQNFSTNAATIINLYVFSCSICR